MVISMLLHTFTIVIYINGKSNMKKIPVALFLLFLTFYANAQMQLWATIGGGGAYGDGTIFKCIPSDSSIKTVFDFDATNGERPFSSLIQAPDGTIYGTTETGGTSGDGVIFKCTVSGSVKTLAEFNNRNGSAPYGSLLYGSDGNLYGMTSSGGDYDSGVIFQCTPAGVINVLVSFNYTTGGIPYGNLIQGSDGNLYGMATFGGGPGDSGAIFKCTTNGVYTKLVNFNSINGGYPFGSLIQASDGYLYGMTLYGGAADSGVIFKCSITGDYSVLVNLNYQTGCYPMGSLIQAFDGNLYGMTQSAGANNGGTLFKCTTNGQLSVLYNFSQAVGETPLGGLIQAPDSSFYGMTTTQGHSGSGNIFQYSPQGVLTNIAPLTGAIFACKPVMQYSTLLAVNPVLGINGILLQSRISTYPNPAGNVLNITSNITDDKAELSIIDITGKELIHKDASIKNGTISIDISELSNGLYLAKLVSGINTETCKFIKE